MAGRAAGTRARLQPMPFDAEDRPPSPPGHHTNRDMTSFIPLGLCGSRLAFGDVAVVRPRVRVGTDSVDRAAGHERPGGSNGRENAIAMGPLSFSPRRGSVGCERRELDVASAALLRILPGLVRFTQNDRWEPCGLRSGVGVGLGPTSIRTFTASLYGP